MKFPIGPEFAFWRTRRLPVLLQTEAAECGLVSICMIANYWGCHLDLAAMRRRFSVSLKGSTLASVMAMAQGLSLQTRPLKLDIAHLGQLKLPCVLHWDMSHFVVLQAVSENGAVIHDPGVGKRRISLDEFGNHFTGVALELMPASGFEARTEVRKYSLRSLMGRVTGLRRGLIQVLVLGLTLQVFALVAPFYLQWIVDEALLASDVDLIKVLGAGFLLLVALQTAAGAVRSWLTTVLATNLNFQWLGNAFAHLMKLPLPFFEKRHIGDIVSRFDSIHIIQRSFTTQFVEGMIDGVLVLGTLLMMFLYSHTLALVACLTVAIYCLLRWVVFGALRDATAEQIVHAARQQTYFFESLRGVQSIRLFGRSEERRAGWMNALVDQFNADLRIAKLSVSYQTANQFLFNAERVIVIWMAALLVLETKLTVGMLFAFIAYKDQFSSRMASLIDKLFELRMLRLHGERVADIVMTEAELDSQEVEIDMDALVPSIEIKNVSFTYADAEPNVLNEINLVIPAGQSIAITGPSGCGKTTLMKLMLGLLEPTKGEILIGGVKLSRLGLANYRQMLGTVMQEDALFAGSIADNISFFSPGRDMAKVIQSAKMAGIDGEISVMPMGYNTLVGDIGTGLSGGQRQRILLARALYREPKLLVLDEATSHLDVWNEKLVNSAIAKLALTRVIVAHRPETIAAAQRLIVVREGRIVHDAMQQEANNGVAA